MLTEYKDLLTIRDLAEIFNMTKQTIYREVKTGKFGKPIKIGREYRISKAYIVENFIKTAR